MFSLADIYTPVTAAPFRCNSSYMEISPCEHLKPYIRCFWGTYSILSEVAVYDNSIVIPDTCMDIIFNFDYVNNITTCSFCTIDEQTHTAAGTCINPGISSFGIRFYPWSAALFSDKMLNNSKNQCFNADLYFGELVHRLNAPLHHADSIIERVRIAERILMKILPSKPLNTALMNSLYYALSKNGNTRVSDICSYAAISPRQLERIYENHLGISPKAFADLIRYQLLWQDILFGKDFDIFDAVEKFGYYDQAHLLRDFKRRHLMTPKEALTFALANK